MAHEVRNEGETSKTTFNIGAELMVRGKEIQFEPTYFHSEQIVNLIYLNGIATIQYNTFSNQPGTTNDLKKI